MDWMFMPLKRYADFNGRSRRKEYWMFSLFIFIVYIVLAVLGGGLGAMTGSAEASGSLVSILLGIFILGMFIPMLAVQIRRFHDQGKSGWFVLLGFIPIVGGLIVLVFMCLEGTAGPNEYGPDPKSSADPEVFN